MLYSGAGHRKTIWRMRFACWIPKATNAHSGCVILLTFLLQQWLQDCASLLRHTYIAVLYVTRLNERAPVKMK